MKQKIKIILFVVLFLAIGFFIYNNYISAEKDYCSIIKATPSWIQDEQIIKVGYINFWESKQMCWDYVNQYLIPNKIYFVYRDSCGWCQKQIDDMKKINLWGDYQQSGLTVDCD